MSRLHCLCKGLSNNEIAEIGRETVMGKPPETLARFIKMANAAIVDLGPCAMPIVQRLPKTQVVGRGERLGSTVLYVAENPLATLGNYHRARQLRNVLLKVAEAGEFIKQRIEGKKHGRLFISKLSSTRESEERQFLRSLTVGLPVVRTRQLAELSPEG